MRIRKKVYRVSTLFVMLVFALSLVMPLCVSAGDAKPYFIDEAGLVSAEEAQQLEEALTAAGAACDMEFVILTTMDESISSPMEEADDFYDHNGYGVGEDHSGTLLYINMATRDWWISTCGYGITAFTDDGIQYIGEKVVENLGDEYYYEAFEEYIALCQQFVEQARTGEPYYGSNMPKEPYSVFGTLVISLIVGLVVALIYILILRGQLKSVAPNNQAIDYAVNGSMHVTNSREFFLYRTLSRTEKPKDNDNNGPVSTTHVSSSGTTHGGGGGKF